MALLNNKQIRAATAEELRAEIVRAADVIKKSADRLANEHDGVLAPQYVLILGLEPKYLKKLVDAYEKFQWGTGEP